MAGGAMNGRTAEKAALLIDADNVSPEGMVRALAHLRGLDMNVCVRRAYGSHETLVTVREFLQDHGVRGIVNQGKGTTDAALIVDAMDLLHAGTLPLVVAIASGDADFAPLVVRLREGGRQLMCFAQKRKAAEGLERFYDVVVHVDAAAAASAPLPKPAAKKVARKKAAPAKPPAPPADPVFTVLQSFPGFLAGHELELNAVVKKLRDEKLMGKGTSVRNFFGKHAPGVELIPEKQPNKLRWNARG